MRFEFDTNTVNGRDLMILNAIVLVLNGPSNEQPQATVGDNGASGTTESLPSDATGPGESEDSPASVKPARIRRTKAQILADQVAAEKAFADKQLPIVLTQGQQDAMDDTAGILTATQTAAIAGAVDGTADATVTLTTEQVAKIVDLDALRTALQGYTAKHDLAAGITLLGAFDCKRISDVLNIPAERQQAFLLACNV